METIYFPNDRKVIDAMLKVFSRKIIYHADWQENFSKDAPPEEIINNAMYILRIVDSTGARNKKRADERVKLIYEKWPDIPSAPNGLRNIRNKIEHVEEYYDEWFSTVNSPVVIDLDITFGMLYRYDPVNGIAYYLEEEVSIPQVMEWVRKVHDCLRTSTLKNNVY